jgi:hypothetical protein
MLAISSGCISGRIIRELDRPPLTEFKAYASTRLNAGHRPLEKGGRSRTPLAGSEHIPSLLPSCRTMRDDEKGGSDETTASCVLGKTNELTGPHFDCVAIVHDVVARFEAAMVEVLVLVDARIVVVGKRYKYNRS